MERQWVAVRFRAEDGRSSGTYAGPFASEDAAKAWVRKANGLQVPGRFWAVQRMVDAATAMATLESIADARDARGGGA